MFHYTLQNFDHEKATQAINFFAIKNGKRIGKLKFLKLMYLADRFHLRRWGRPIVNDQYYAMQFGPVASSAKDIFELEDIDSEEHQYASQYLRTSRKHEVESIGEFDESVFSESDIDALAFAFENFGENKTKDLVDITHIYPEWTKHAASIKKGSRRVMMNYMDFFENPENFSDDKFQLNEDILKAAKEIFVEECQIAEMWY